MSHPLLQRLGTERVAGEIVLEDSRETIPQLSERAKVRHDSARVRAAISIGLPPLPGLPDVFQRVRHIDSRLLRSHYEVDLLLTENDDRELGAGHVRAGGLDLDAIRPVDRHWIGVDFPILARQSL